jgi:hypothetical protein
MTKLPKPVKTIAASNSPLPYKTITGEAFSQRINRKGRKGHRGFFVFCAFFVVLSF